MGGHHGLPLVGTESIKNLARKELFPSLLNPPHFRIILYWKRIPISGSFFDWKMLGGQTWIPGAYDPETKLYIFGTGNPTPAYTTGTRGDGNATSQGQVVRQLSGEEDSVKSEHLARLTLIGIGG